MLDKMTGRISMYASQAMNPESLEMKNIPPPGASATSSCNRETGCRLVKNQKKAPPPLMDMHESQLLCMRAVSWVVS